MSKGSPGRAKEAPGQPRNWVQPFLLLSLDQWQSHGYELIRRLTVFGFETVDPGSVYRTLRQLEQEGLLESDWETANGGPARRRYALTDAGREYLEGWAGTLRSYQHMLEAFFNTYPDGDHADDHAVGEPDSNGHAAPPENR